MLFDDLKNVIKKLSIRLNIPEAQLQDIFVIAFALIVYDSPIISHIALNTPFGIAVAVFLFFIVPIFLIRYMLNRIKAISKEIKEKREKDKKENKVISSS